MLKNIAKIIGFTLLAVYLVSAGFIYHIGKEELCYRNVHISICDSADLSFIQASDIQQLMRQNKINPIGQPIDRFNTYALSDLISKNLLIKEAKCYHTSDSTLRIDIYQRHPIMRVKNNIGKDFYIDTDGKIMPSQAGIAIYLPIATGNISEDLAQSQLYEFASFLQKNDFWRSEITQIHVLKNGDVELIPRIGNHTILLGSFNDFEEKLDNLMTFYRKILNTKGWNTYKTINIKFKGQVIGER